MLSKHEFLRRVVFLITPHTVWYFLCDCVFQPEWSITFIRIPLSIPQLEYNLSWPNLRLDCTYISNEIVPEKNILQEVQMKQIAPF